MTPREPESEATFDESGVRRRILGAEFSKARAKLTRERTSAQTTKEEAAMDFFHWSAAIPTAIGGKLDFDRFPFQPEIYRVFGDPAIKDAVVMKGTQVGASELLVRGSLYFADVHGETIVYVFPAAKQVKDFADTRIDKLLEHSSYLRSRKGHPWNKGLKKIGRGFVFFRGSQAKNDLISVAAGVLVMDEYDSLAPENIPEAEQRVAGSLLALIRRVGVPSDPEYGIAKLYEQSDQRRWHVECDECGELQTIEFEANVRWDSTSDGQIVNERRVCRHCEHLIDVRRGEWIAKYPDRPRPGFHVNRLMVHETDLVRLIQESKLRQPHHQRSFRNNGLGLPYDESDGGLDRSTIAAAISAGASFNDGEPLRMQTGYSGGLTVTAGIDVASVRGFHIRISVHLDSLLEANGRKRALFVGMAATSGELASLLDRYEVNFAVIDGMPEQHLALGLAEQYPGRVYLASYASNLSEPWVIDTEGRRVSARRHVALDATISLMQSQRNLLPEDLPDDYVDHLVAVRRRTSRDTYDRQTVTHESYGADDYFHAEVYDLLATEVARVRLKVAALESGAGELVRLDDLLDFPRSDANDYESMDYRPGPGGDY